MRRVLIAATVAAATFAAPADAYRIGGRAWPTTTVEYHTSARAYSGAVDRAARIMNRAGVGIRLRRVERGAADVVVAYGGEPCNGRAPLGFQRYRISVVTIGPRCRPRLATLTAVHELGHVLGLDHEIRRCARMNPTFDRNGSPTRCARHKLSYWLAHPLTADDRAGLRAIYGG